MIIVWKVRGKFAFNFLGKEAQEFKECVPLELLIHMSKEAWKQGKIEISFEGKKVSVEAEINRQLALMSK